MPTTEEEEAVIKPPKRASRLERVMSADGSCIVSDSDLKFIALNSNLSLKEVRGLFADLLHGKIERESFKNVTKLCYPHVDLVRLEDHVYSVFDPDGTESIDFRRFMLVIMALSGGTPEENVEKIFYMVDKNNDGFISAEEYKSVTTDILLLANERKLSMSNKDHLTRSTFDEMDANMDGKVDLREFIRACDKHNYIIFQYMKTFVNTYIKN